MSLFGLQQHFNPLLPSYNLMLQMHPYAESIYHNLALQARFYQYNQYNEAIFPKCQQYIPLQPEIAHNTSVFEQSDLLLPQQTKIQSPILTRKSWTAEEDRVLMAWVKENGLSSWGNAENLIEGRTAKQCKQRWYNKNNKRKQNSRKKGKWTHEEDQLIRSLYKQYGPQWEKMAEHLPGKTENTIKNRFYYYQRCLVDQKVDNMSLLKYQNHELSTANGTPDEKKFSIKTESETLVQAQVQVKKEELSENENLLLRQQTLSQDQLEEIRRSLDASEASEMDIEDLKFQSFLLQSGNTLNKENLDLDNLDEELEVLQKKNFYFCEQNMKNLSRTVFLGTFNPLQELTTQKQKHSEENKIRRSNRILVPKHEESDHQSQPSLSIVKQSSSASKSTTSQATTNVSKRQDENANRVIEEVEKAVRTASLLYMSCLDDMKKTSSNIKDKEELSLLFKKLDSLEAVVMSSKSALESVNPIAAAAQKC